ncbi:sigma-70 family RNA polymerase sigma factor [Cohnella lubricantis]|uniref:Sigma-70 family RNA polymerase sigma factor n=2 Tax=Cohnella lubricantis TaxID=2163172 RepID=A0A841TCF1_9BACL|nr:sigma-70 family RNA polymerase sigma factor [Cohnella lubricantis]MBP2118558.1 RNA polymerase sigma-70 factor (ECF subfamily) [Cohnella lubricantis]
MNGTAIELQLFENLKPELTSFCYRMLGSIDDADDAVQETYICVWQNWHSFRQDSSFKTWVYRIASNLCLDKLRQTKRRMRPVDLSDSAVSSAELRELPDSAWIWPAPEFSENPEAIIIRKDTLKLCFIALLQLLPPRQRAILILKDVFEWSSKQIAETLGTSPAAVNSALQRARETMDRAKLHSNELSMMDVEPDRELLSRYVEAFEQFDIQALVALFHEEGRLSMPPFAMWVRGRVDLSKFFALTRWHCEGSRFLPITANGGYPALAQYVPSGEGSCLVPWGIHMIEIKDKQIYHVQNFINTNLFARFGLPAQIHR